ncbi:UNVERIFIED_CONTAM: hypothetical protein FKN15_052639 [Acipenser sinensis]
MVNDQSVRNPSDLPLCFSSPVGIFLGTFDLMKSRFHISSPVFYILHLMAGIHKSNLCRSSLIPRGLWHSLGIKFTKPNMNADVS